MAAHDPHIHRTLRRGPHGAHLARLEDAQEPALERERHLADLVEEQGPPVGLQEGAEAALGGAREGPALVAEQLALDQVGDDRTAVDGDELAAPAALRWMARAASSLPVPLSPRSKADARVGATRAISSRSRFMPRL